MFLGIDTGGTFTDFVLFDGRQLRIHKVLSTPHAPEQAILQGITDLGLDPGKLLVVHGSTVATNAVLEGKGVRTAYITNRGLGDLLSIGRQARRELYNLQPKAPIVPVPRQLCIETGGRLNADGELLEPLTAGDLESLNRQLRELKPAAVAINFLFSFLDDRQEKKVESAIPAGVFVARSSAVLPEYREYERGIATWLTAYVGPLVEGYLQRLQDHLAPAPFSVMQSSGFTVSAAQAGSKAVNLLLSGPAGGLMGARFVGAAANCQRLLTIDMGGTSTDVALIDHEIQLTNEGCVGPYPVAVPMVDMYTIGAGGGSLAKVDTGGVLQIGPQSAGADPGPACYGRGGAQATVTDANLVLGRLRADAFLGGAMLLDIEAARTAVKKLGTDLGVSIEAAALGVVRVANQQLARALRVISVQRGIDPRSFVLISFGGAGGLHVCALAEALAMTRALVPVHGGVLSALGMLTAPRGRQLSRTVNGPLQEFESARLEAEFLALAEQAYAALKEEGVARQSMRTERSLDLRYQGQSYTLNVAWQGIEVTAQAFHDAHEQRFGHRLDTSVELVNVRVGVSSPPSDIRLAPAPSDTGTTEPRHVALPGIMDAAALWRRESLISGQVFPGPALITETVATTYVAPGWRCHVDPLGNLLLELGT